VAVAEQVEDYWNGGGAVVVVMVLVELLLGTGSAEPTQALVEAEVGQSCLQMAATAAQA
jgi:hypothetical protein